MQRIQRRRYPVNNPFGDKIFVKFRCTTGGNLQAPSVAAPSAGQTWNLNDLGTAVGNGGAPGLEEYSLLFKRYRITGAKVKVTIYNEVSSDAFNVDPAWGFITASSDAIDMSDYHLSDIQHLRWVKYKPLNNWTSGARATTISAYFSCLKVFGADRTIPDDLDYTATTNSAGTPFYNTPSITAGVGWGVVKANASNWGASESIGQYTQTVTYYAQLWDPELGQTNV